MRRFFLIISILKCFIFWAQPTVPIIPKPLQLKVEDGPAFVVNAQTNILTDNSLAPLKKILEDHPFYQDALLKKTGEKNLITIKLKKLPKDYYKLRVEKDTVTIEAGSYSSALNGVYTFIQLLYFNRNHEGIRPLNISDNPRFQYRGLLLDASRHFIAVDNIKKFIDVMALYKFNQLHWHLTDGPGWRIEIKKYPLLTEKAAWRNYHKWEDWWDNGRQYVSKENPNAYGGFYTQNEVKDIVRYASERGINIIPEIEMPGHSEEVLAVYPQLSCTGKPYTSSEFCIGNKNTISFLKDILDEIVELFPSKYIHIGGDEADHKHWKNCTKCQAFIAEMNLKDEYGLQNYLVKEIEKYLNAKGRTTIAWDEVTERDIPSRLIVMNWHNAGKGQLAANKGHDIIMTPYDFMYLNQYQGDPENEPLSLGGYLPLEKVYSYEPLAGVDYQKVSNHILGVQGCLWSELIPNQELLEYMAFPRALAISEISWSTMQNKIYHNFKERLNYHYSIFNSLGINYRRPTLTLYPKIDYLPGEKKMKLCFESEHKNPEIRYTLNGKDPTINDPKFAESMLFDKSAIVKAAIFENGYRIGKVQDAYIYLHNAINKKVTYLNSWEGYPAQKEKTLTNGVQGGKYYSDGQWQAFGANGMSVIIDMEGEKYHKILMRFMQQKAVGIYFPGEIKIYVSKDLKNFKSAGEIKINIGRNDNQPKSSQFEISLTKPFERYLKIEASNPMKAYIFTDEIVVE